MGYYSGISEGYERLYKAEQLEKLEIIRKHLKPKPPLLDIGAGTGISTSFFKIPAVALDPSRKMLEKYPGKKVCARAEKMPFPDSHFLTIIAITSLHHVDIGKVIQEIRRVSAKGCQYAFSLLKRAKNFQELRAKLMKAFRLREYDSAKDLILISRSR